MSPGYYAVFTSWTPQDLLASLVAAVCFLAPGVGPAIAAARRLRWGAAAVVAGSFAASSALAAVSMLVGTWLGLTLEAGIALWLVLAAAAAVGSYFLGRGQARVSADLPGLAIAGVAVLAGLIERPWFKISADTFYHVAAARSLLVRDALTVTDPFHGTAIGVADPTSGVLHTMLAMVSRTTGMDMAVVWAGLTVVGGAVLVCGFYALVRRLAGARWAAAVGTLAYVVANQFVDFRASAYPNRISMVVVFFGVLCLAEVLDRPSWTAAGAAVIAGVSVSALHVGTAEFFWIAGAALAFWALVDGLVARLRDGRFAFDGFGALAGVLAASAVLSLPFILPKFGVVASSAMVDTAAAVSRVDLFQMGPLVITRPGRFFDGGTLPFVMTTALALFMGGWALVRRDRVGLAALALCSLPAVLLVDPPVTTLAVRLSFYNLARIAQLFGFTTYVAIAWALARPKGSGGRSQAVFLASIALVAMLGISVPYLQTTYTPTTGATRKGMNVSVFKSRAEDMRNLWGADTVARIAGALPSYPMVAAEDETGYLFSGFASVRLVAVPRSHSPLAVEVVDGPQRREDMRLLLFPTATAAERRAILTRWEADYVLLWSARQTEKDALVSMLGQPELFEPVDVSGALTLLRVKR
ncbi:MAG TPA: hypothetical protein VF902_09350 [Coriobacteriia bacterium]